MAQAPEARSSALNDQFLEAQNPALQQRVTMAIAKAAVAVGQQPADTPQDQARKRLAEQVARQPSMFAQPFTTLVTTQGITSSSDDAQVEYVVQSVWNVMAGSQ